MFLFSSSFSHFADDKVRRCLIFASFLILFYFLHVSIDSWLETEREEKKEIPLARREERRGEEERKGRVSFSPGAKEGRKDGGGGLRFSLLSLSFFLLYFSIRKGGGTGGRGRGSGRNFLILFRTSPKRGRGQTPNAMKKEGKEIGSINRIDRRTYVRT